MNALLTRKIHIPFNKISKNIKEILENLIKKEIEGKCTVEGFIKPNSTNIKTYSSGILSANLVEFDVVFECLVCCPVSGILSANLVEFDVVFECLVCCPVEGMTIDCIVKNKTQAGIRALINDDISPVVIYISRDHHYNNKYFNLVKDEEEIKVKVIGQRYELNDPQVSVIGEIIEPKPDKYKKKPKKLVLK